MFCLMALLLTACTSDDKQGVGDDTQQFTFDVVEQPWEEEKVAISRSGETLEGLRSIGAARLWSFESIPVADITALGESSLWSYNDGTKTYTNTAAVNGALKGGSGGTTELTFTKDLIFSATTGSIHLVNDGSDNCIRFTGDLTINNLKNGQAVTVVSKSLVVPGPPMNVSNVTGSPVIPASSEKASQTRTVAANGSVTLSATAPVKIYSISVSAAEDDGFGLYCSELSISNTQVTWDDVNGKWKIGSGYNTYWRRGLGGTLNIYAYAPYKPSPYTIESGILTFNAEKYDVPGGDPLYSTRLSGSNVDLLYASQTSYARNSSEPAKLTFEHALAKMTFGTITNNTGGTLYLNGFTISGTMYESAKLNLSTGVWSDHVVNSFGKISSPPPFIYVTTDPSEDIPSGYTGKIVVSPLYDKETIIPPMPSRELSFIPGSDGTLSLTVEVNSSVVNETFSFPVTLVKGMNKTYNITIGKNYEVIIN